MLPQNNPDSLAQLLDFSASQSPLRTAVYFNDQEITYDTLKVSSDRLSQGLVNLGVKKENVAILLHNGIEFIISYFSAVKASCAAVPINNMFKEEEIEYILDDSKATVVISSVEFLSVLISIKAKSASLKYIILTDALTPETLNFYEIIERSPGKKNSIILSPDDIATILYTSGTTGRPKGAMLTHKNLLSNVSSCLNAVDVSGKDNFICLLPMFHSFAWTVCVLMPLYIGAGLTVVDSLRPFRKLIRNVVRKKVTVFIGIPSIFHILSQIQIPAVFTARVLRMIDPLRFCISGAAALPKEVLSEFQAKFKVPLLEGYGLTEASPVVSLNPLKGKQKPQSVGVPLRGVEVKIEDGELLVKGLNVMKGYFNDPDATNEAIKDGWLYTGDIAKIDEDGYIYIVDRKKEMINVRGLNVYPKEVENILLGYPNIKEVAVVKYFDKNKGEVPRAFVVLNDPKTQFMPREAIKFCRQHLAEFKIPKTFEVVNKLPKNTLGKVLKKDLEHISSLGGATNP